MEDEKKPPEKDVVAPGGRVEAVAEKGSAEAGREEEVVPMSRLRRTAAERLVQAQHTAALLTTFNEIDMGSVVALRNSSSGSKRLLRTLPGC